MSNNKYNISESTFKDLKVLVIGDAMLDRYFLGEVKRQSPEADVPVVSIDAIDNKLGGAANVALNIKKMNAQVELICCLGKDQTGLDFLNVLEDHQIVSNRILVFDDRQTTLKGRIYNNKNYLLRLDQESIEDFTENESVALLNNIQDSIDEFNPNIAILQDYNKGLFTKSNISRIVQLLQANNIKIAVDPKEKNFLAFQNVDLFKPNLKEISEALGLAIDLENKSNLKSVCAELQQKINCKNSLITLSEKGVICYDENRNFNHFPAFKRNVIDVSGAGDTVISVASLFLALDFDLDQIAYFSNLAGGITIETKGVNALEIENFISVLNNLEVH